MAKSFDELAQRVMSPESLGRAEQRAEQKIAEYLLRELRESAGISQNELATRLGIKQPTLSKLENKPDLKISTIQRIVEGLGGRLKLVADLPDVGQVIIRQVRTKKRRSRHAAT